MPDNDTNVINDNSGSIDDVFSPDEPTSPVEPSPDPQPAEGGVSNPQPAESSEPPSNAQSSQSAQQTPQSSSLTADDIAKATTKALDQYSKANARNAEANRPMTEAEFNKLFNRIPVQAKVLEAILNPETPMVNKVQALQMILDQNANHAVARANYLVQAAVQKAVAQYQQQMAPIVRNYSAQEAKKSIDDFAAAADNHIVRFDVRQVISLVHTRTQ